jgi:hypothetical protein
MESQIEQAERLKTLLLEIEAIALRANAEIEKLPTADDLSELEGCLRGIEHSAKNADTEIERLPCADELDELADKLEEMAGNAYSAKEAIS